MFFLTGYDFGTLWRDIEMAGNRFSHYALFPETETRFVHKNHMIEMSAAAELEMGACQNTRSGSTRGDLLIFPSKEKICFS